MEHLEATTRIKKFIDDEMGGEDKPVDGQGGSPEAVPQAEEKPTIKDPKTFPTLSEIKKSPPYVEQNAILLKEYEPSFKEWRACPHNFDKAIEELNFAKAREQTAVIILEYKIAVYKTKGGDLDKLFDHFAYEIQKYAMVTHTFLTQIHKIMVMFNITADDLGLFELAGIEKDPELDGP